MNNKGFMRIVEATIAVLIVIGALLILNNQNVENPVSDIGGDLVRVLDEISQNVSLRIEIVSSLDEE
ncbi:MAG: hypothetical protein KC506_03550, partial [Nanoarchaeota archaeon]|nr:hypothetical protein [Nanoarchaeota archaeon]